MQVCYSRNHFHYKIQAFALATLCFVFSAKSAAQDAKELYSKKCASCHAAGQRAHRSKQQNEGS